MPGSSYKGKPCSRRRLKSVVKNVNDNHSNESTVSRKCHRSKQNESNEVAKTKRHQTRSQSREISSDELDYIDNVDQDNLQTVSFEENDDLVEMGITSDQGSQFPSENEASDSNESEEEGELGDDTEDRRQGDPKLKSRQQTRRVATKSKTRVEDKVDELSKTVRAMQDMMKEKGLLEEFQRRRKSSTRRESSDSNNQGELDLSNSETTIYQEALQMESEGDNEFKVDKEVSFKVTNQNKRVSSSSEDQVDTSDDMLDVDNFIADCANQAKTQRIANPPQGKGRRSQGDEAIRESEASKV